jgi:hypothetical protein
LHEPGVAGAAEQRLDAVQRILDAAALGFARLRPFVNHGGGEFEVGGNFLRCFGIEDFAEQFVGFHDEKMGKCGGLGKREAMLECGWANFNYLHRQAFSY